ncbi:hypothetical protein M011DRAFT_289063 [Sporormia fimetaria CBS 119925]|uniref:Uncharacterized protein n=1 Tax=Sporormia fimetaria CBS 119925 TaxID=1340428 RepID=A0A6A6UX77_9PLEO|nr:hypothetical protein M011DRAFT_289063 [Sporormia fimetaria CBS 119925]
MGRPTRPFFAPSSSSSAKEPRGEEPQGPQGQVQQGPQGSQAQEPRGQRAQGPQGEVNAQVEVQPSEQLQHNVFPDADIKFDELQHGSDFDPDVLNPDMYPLGSFDTSYDHSFDSSFDSRFDSTCGSASQIGPYGVRFPMVTDPSFGPPGVEHAVITSSPLGMPRIAMQQRALTRSMAAQSGMSRSSSHPTVEPFTPMPFQGDFGGVGMPGFNHPHAHSSESCTSVPQTCEFQPPLLLSKVADHAASRVAVSPHVRPQDLMTDMTPVSRIRMSKSAFQHLVKKGNYVGPEHELSKAFAIGGKENDMLTAVSEAEESGRKWRRS